MAQYAYNYNDIYDEYIVQAAPMREHESEAMPPKPEYRRIGRTKEQVIKANQRKFKIALAKTSIVLAAFIAVIGMGVMSFVQVGNAKQALADVNAAYQQSLEQNNELKLQLDNILAGENIPKYAEEVLGFEKIPAKRQFVVDVSRYQ